MTPTTALQALLADVLKEYDAKTCRHESTHRGGAIWTICDDCGQKWADDRGGFQPYKDSPVIAKARAALSAPAQDAQAGLKDALVEHLCDNTLVSVYDCTRVWEAWQVGTMSEDDFVPASERADEIADDLIAFFAARTQPATPPAAPHAPCGGRENCGRFPFCGCGDDALPERDTSKPAEQQGLFRKFEVRRTDGSDQPGGKHHGCEYFVLDTNHDPAAKPALAAYADAIEATHKPLADDMRARYGLDAVPQAVPLTDAQILYELKHWNFGDIWTSTDALEFAREVERAHGIGTTATKGQQ